MCVRIFHRDQDWYNSHACTATHPLGGSTFGLTWYKRHMYNINALRLWLNKRLRWLTERLTHAKRSRKKYSFVKRDQCEARNFFTSPITDRIITWVSFICFWFCDHFWLKDIKLNWTHAKDTLFLFKFVALLSKCDMFEAQNKITNEWHFQNVNTLAY